jgi:hypothetical protein
VLWNAYFLELKSLANDLLRFPGQLVDRNALKFV